MAVVAELTPMSVTIMPAVGADPLAFFCHKLAVVSLILQCPLPAGDSPNLSRHTETRWSSQQRAPPQNPLIARRRFGPHLYATTCKRTRHILFIYKDKASDPHPLFCQRDAYKMWGHGGLEKIAIRCYSALTASADVFSPFTGAHLLSIGLGRLHQPCWA
jgi:hypothetical protein